MDRDHGNARGPDERQSRRGLLLLLVVTAGLLGAGINPHHLPESTDDIIYFELAKSWASGEGHTYQGEVIGDWPPLFPLMLSVPIRLGCEALWAGKLVVAGCALGALALAWRLLLRERRELPLLTVALMALLPTAWLHGIRTSSDWPFALISFGFLLILYSLRDRPGVGRALGAGALLAAAALTRQVGVLLGAAVISQVLGKWLSLPASDRWRPPLVFRLAWPEALASLIGAGAWLGWGAWLGHQRSQGLLAAGNYDTLGAALWMSPDLPEMLGFIAELLFQFSNLVEAAGSVGAAAAPVLLAVFGILLALGVFRTIRERRWQPSDAYALATMALILPYEFKNTRFWIVVAPFLLNWFFRGLGWISRQALRAWPRLPLRQAGRAGNAVWVAGCVAVIGVLLFRGNGSDHGPLFGARPATPEAFYRGFYADLRRASLRMASDFPEETIGVRGWYANYVHHFSGGGTVHNWEFDPDDFDVFLQTSEPELPEALAGKFQPLFEEGAVKAWRRVTDQSSFPQ